MSLDPTCVQNFRPVPLTVFKILGFKQKNNNDNDDDKKNWRNGFFAISLMLMDQILGRHTYCLSYHPAVSKVDYN